MNAALLTLWPPAFRKASSTHYDKDHIEGEMKLNTPAQESAGGWMEVQPTSEKPAIPEESVSWKLHEILLIFTCLLRV